MSALPSFLDEVPLTVLDVGARGGLDLRWNPFLRSINAILAEPDPDEAAALRAALQSQGLREVRVIPKALGRQPGSATLYLTRNPECSSLLRPNYEWLDRFPDADRLRVVREIPIEIDTLDAQMAAAGWAEQPCDFIKVDVQGYELEVLLGGEKAVASSLFVEAEVSFHPIYVGQPLFPQIGQHLSSRGFQLLDLERILWRRKDVPLEISSRNQVIWANVLYYRDPLALPSLDRPTVIRALKVLLAYQFHDVTAELLASAVQRGLLTGQEREATLSWMRRDSLFTSAFWRWVKRLPVFRGRRTIERIAGLSAHQLGINYGEGVVVDAESWNRRWHWK